MQSTELSSKQLAFVQSLVQARGQRLRFAGFIEKHNAKHHKIESRVLVISDTRVTSLKAGAFKLSVRRDGHLFELRSMTCAPDDPQTLHLVFPTFLLSFRSARAADVVQRYFDAALMPASS